MADLRLRGPRLYEVFFTRYMAASPETVSPFGPMALHESECSSGQVQSTSALLSDAAAVTTEGLDRFTVDMRVKLLSSHRSRNEAGQEYSLGQSRVGGSPIWSTPSTLDPPQAESEAIATVMSAAATYRRPTHAAIWLSTRASQQGRLHEGRS